MGGQEKRKTLFSPSNWIKFDLLLEDLRLSIVFSQPLKQSLRTKVVKDLYLSLDNSHFHP